MLAMIRMEDMPTQANPSTITLLRDAQICAGVLV